MTAPIRYEATDDASRALSAADPALAAVIDAVGCVEFGDTPGGLLGALARGIIGQQVSEYAAEAIFGRLAKRVGLSAEALANAPAADLRAAGVSGRKARYLREAARAVLDGTLDLDALDALDDEAAVRELSRFDGVGPWTARMFLIFALGRPDVLVADDVGIRAAAGSVLGLGRPATADELRAAGERWRPYRSAAMLYLSRRGRRGPGGTCDESRVT